MMCRMMQQETMQQYRKQLLALRATMLATTATAQEAARPVTLDQNSVGRLSRMDAMQGQAMAIEGLRRRDQLLQEIQAALARMDSGTYGLCLECDEPINPRRLTVDPVARLCIACASQQE